MPEKTPKLFAKFDELLEDINKSNEYFIDYLSLLNSIKQSYETSEEFNGFSVLRTENEKMDLAKASAMSGFFNKYFKEDYVDSLITYIRFEADKLSKIDDNYEENSKILRSRLAIIKFFMKNDDDKERFNDVWKEVYNKIGFNEKRGKEFFDSIEFDDIVLDENTVENLFKKSRREEPKEITKLLNDKLSLIKYFKTIEGDGEEEVENEGKAIDKLNKAIKKAQERKAQTEELYQTILGQVKRQDNQVPEKKADPFEEIISQTVFERYTKDVKEIEKDIRYIVSTAEELRSRQIANESHGFFYNLFLGSWVKEERLAIQRELEKLAEISEKPELIREYVNCDIADNGLAKENRKKMLKAETAKLTFYNPAFRNKLNDELLLNYFAVTSLNGKVEKLLSDFEKNIENKNKELVEVSKEINKKIDEALLKPAENDEKSKLLPASIKEKLGMDNYSVIVKEFEDGYITSSDAELENNFDPSKAVDEFFNIGYFNIKGNLYLAGEKFIEKTLKDIKENPQNVTAEDFEKYAKKIYGNYRLMETMGLFDKYDLNNDREEAIVNYERLKTREMFVSQILKFQKAINDISKLDFELPKTVKDRNEDIEKWKKASVQESIWVENAGIKNISGKYHEINNIKEQIKIIHDTYEKLYEERYVHIEKKKDFVKKKTEDFIKTQVEKMTDTLLTNGVIKEQNSGNINKELLDLEKEFVDREADDVYIPGERDVDEFFMPTMPVYDEKTKKWTRPKGKYDDFHPDDLDEEIRKRSFGQPKTSKKTNELDELQK